jgi:excisionase family DNA binding protein
LHDQLLTADEVAELLRLPRTRVVAMARDGVLPVVRLGERTLRFRPEDVESFTTPQRGDRAAVTAGRTTPSGGNPDAVPEA